MPYDLKVVATQAPTKQAAGQPETAQERLRQALDMMATGLRWKRQALARLHPGATEQELEVLYERWLLAND